MSHPHLTPLETLLLSQLRAREAELQGQILEQRREIAALKAEMARLQPALGDLQNLLSSLLAPEGLAQSSLP